METLVPSLRLKTNELFFKWLSESDKQDQLKELIDIIKSGKQNKLNDFQNYFKEINSKSYQMRPKSPTIQSPPMSPVSRMPNSPKSPKRKFNSKLSKSQLFNNNDMFNKDQYIQPQLAATIPGPQQIQLQQQQQIVDQLTNNDLKDLKSSKSNKLNNNEKEIIIERTTSSVSGNNNYGANNVNLELLNKDSNLNENKLNNNKKIQLDSKGNLVQSLSENISKLMNNEKLLKSKDQASKLANNQKIVQIPAAIQVPQFYFPYGKPEDRKDDQEILKLANLEFSSHKDGKVYKEDFENVVKAVGLPRYWKILLFRSCIGSSKLDYVTFSMFEQLWKKLSTTCFNRASLFLKLMAPGHCNYLVYEDWEPLMQDIVDTHPGLKFLHDHKEFHTRYIKTVIARIYYYVNRSWSGKITVTELKLSNFLSILETLELEDDINLIKDYFSYEHFYVIYCKFWELDKDHDLYISKEDLYRHNNYSISQRVIDRIFSGTVIRSKDWRDSLMSYYDFVWFLISEEDKRNPTSVEYWFRILDIDGDGVLSMYELEYFYNEQVELMKERQIEYMPFTDLLCQILDLVKPKEDGKIRLKDLKQCKLTNVFYDTFINLEKYLEYEQRDPFSNLKDLDGPEPTDWQKYASEEYENLVSEDGNADNQDFNYDEDFEDEPLLFNNALASKNFQHQIDSLGLMTNSSNLASLNIDSPLSSSSSSNNSSNRNKVIHSPTPNTSSFVSNRSNYDER